MPYKDPKKRAAYEVARRKDAKKHARRLELDKLRYHAPGSKYRKHDSERHAESYRKDPKLRRRILKQNRKWRENNPELARQINRRGHRLRDRGWSHEDFEAAWEAQGGRCAVCETQLSRMPYMRNSAAADHCHVTSKKRGILCRTCNVVEGFLRVLGMPPVEWAVRLTAYLRRFE